MKKTKKTVAILLGGMMMISGLTACGGTPTGSNSESSSVDLEQVIDKSKKQILFSVFNGGYGYEWAIRHAKAWNATNEEYEVIVSPNKDEWYSIAANLAAGTCQYDIMQNTPATTEYALGYLENLNDILNSPADGETNTLYQKSYVQSRIDSALSYNGECFALPMFDGVSGFVYDHEIFLDKCF